MDNINNNNGKYDDIINLEHPILKHKRMSIRNRAAQFAPFAALTGHDEMIEESAKDMAEQMNKRDSEKYYD